MDIQTHSPDPITPDTRLVRQPEKTAANRIGTRPLQTSEELLNAVREVIELEATALSGLVGTIDGSFVSALQLMHACAGKIVLTGVGKSGLIAKKIAATLTSTGTMATFLHPADGMHGDLGLVGPNDVVVAIGKSGESEELTALLPAVKRIGAKIVAITARVDSSLGKSADVTLVTPVEKEACPLNLAPTVSTTLALAVGDALAVALMKMKDFRSEDFARYHPGGKLGKRLLLHVADLMIPLSRCAVLDASRAKMEDVVMALTEFGLGVVLFMKEDSLEGILTDGDIRRLLQVHRTDLFDVPLSEIINFSPLTISSEILAVEALKFMEDRKRPLNVVPAVRDGKVVGVVRLHELFAVS
jgi:arabinose-5-phosphate isomerase